MQKILSGLFSRFHLSDSYYPPYKNREISSKKTFKPDPSKI
ncbi:hypothetical protein NSB1T_06485 [Coprobacter fastidiosus NSB1 = JCM 33896]|nr:hypothetical protein NSB1T_06485 [Coprobacter fastidiosus NSB1 = JCM 33896]